MACVNWVYNYQKGKESKYYIKCRIPSVRLISCMLELNKGMDKDFLIVSGDWHDGLHGPTQKGGNQVRFPQILDMHRIFVFT